MTVEDVKKMCEACIKSIDDDNAEKLAKAIAEYRKGWWIFKPSEKMTDAAIEAELRRRMRYYVSYGLQRATASALLRSCKYVASTVIQVSSEDLYRITGGG
jgi:hypothetical protein